MSRSTPHSSKQRGRGGAYKSSRGHNNSRGNSHFQPQRGQNSRVSSCGNCGYQHAKQSQCPARGKTCRKRNKQNHFARVCRSSKNINEVETFFTEAVTEENEEVFFIGSVFDINNVRQEAEPPWFVDINQCGLSTIFKIDTGADVSMVSRNIPVYQKLCPKPKLTRSNAILRGPGGLIHHEGEFQACFSHRLTSVNARCFVIDSSETCLVVTLWENCNLFKESTAFENLCILDLTHCLVTLTLTPSNVPQCTLRLLKMPNHSISRLPAEFLSWSSTRSNWTGQAWKGRHHTPNWRAYRLVCTNCTCAEKGRFER